MRYVRIKLFAAETGYSEKAIRRKIEQGIFVEGIHFRKAPDNCILIDRENYVRWVEGSKITAVKSASHSNGAASAAGKRSI